MDSLEEKLGAVLNNPQMMQQLMTMAQSLNSQSFPPPEQPRQEAVPAFSLPDLDPGMLQKLSGLARQGSIDSNQQALLHALAPYLSGHRIQKLERAMRAAKMAQFAGHAFGSGGFSFFAGR